MKKILIVGAGFTGAVIARELAEAGYSVHIIDKRKHIAGNAFDEFKSGIRVHKYGPHIFHTKMKDVYDYLGKFTEWVPYKHKVKALLSDGRYVTLPVNRATKEAVGAENVLDTFFRPYTLKMWGVPLDKLDPSVIARVPIRDDDNELYFPNDLYQAMPRDGYTALVEKMLVHDNINVMLNTPFVRASEDEYDHVFNAMPIDEYYDFYYGELPYRSLKFHTVKVPLPSVLPSTVVNFTHNGPYTRVTEWKKFPGHGDDPHNTLLTYEEPCDYRDNKKERYYPVKDVDGVNRAVYLKYKAIPNDKVTFVGRLGRYVYCDMDGVVASALSDVRRFLSKQRSDVSV